MKLKIRMIRKVSKYFNKQDRNIFRNVANLLDELGYSKLPYQTDKEFVWHFRREVLSIYHSIPEKNNKEINSGF